MPEKEKGKNWFKHIRQGLFWFFTGIIGVLLILIGLLFLKPVQETIRKQTVAWLEQKLQTEVRLEAVDLHIFRHLILEGLYIEDREGKVLLEASRIAVRIRSINPLSKDIRLGSLELVNASANLYRHPNDSVFNYQFITDAFASEPDSDTGSNSFSIDIGLKEINFSNISFQYADSLEHTAFLAYLHQFRASFNKLSIQEEVLAINQLEAIGCEFNMFTLLNHEPDTDTTEAGYEVISVAPGNWIIEAGHLLFDRCYFSFDNENKPRKPGIFDTNHLAMGGIVVDLEEVVYVGDTLQGYMNRVAFRDTCGLTLNRLQSAFLFTPYELTLTGMVLETPETRITDALLFQYSTLLDFNRFFTDVRLQAKLNNSHIATNDLAYFSSSLKNYRAQIGIDADISGPVSRLSSRGALLRINDAASLITDFTIRGLPNINETLFDVDIYPLSANMPALDVLLGSNVLPEQVQNLGLVNFTGTFTGLISDFVLFGNTTSSIGLVQTDIHLAFNPENQQVFYSGSIATEDLNAGKLAGLENQLGTVSLIANVEGSSNNQVQKLIFSTNISSIDFQGYTYRNIRSSGSLNSDRFDGQLYMDDRNLGLQFDGSIDLSDSIPVMNFYAELEKANLQALGFYPEPLTISTLAEVNVVGTDINTFLGEARFKQLDISSQQHSQHLDSLSIRSALENNIRTTSLTSDLLNVLVKGNYRLDELPGQLEALTQYYVYGTSFNTDSLLPQDFEYTIEGRQLHRLSAPLYPDLERLDALRMAGSFNSTLKQIETRVSLKNLQYQGIFTEQISGELGNTPQGLEYFVKSTDIQINPNLVLPVTSLEGVLLTDSIDLNLKMGRDTDAERLNLYAGVLLKDSIIDLHILPSEIYVNNERWDIQPNNSLKYDFKNFQAENFTLVNGQRQVSVSSVQKPGAGPSLKVLIENFNISDITTVAQYDDYDITGRIDANITVSNPFDSLTLLGFVNINNLVFDGQSIGNLNITATRIYPNPRFNFNLVLKGDNALRSYGYFYEGETDSLNVMVEISKVPFVIAEPFTTGLMSNLRGDAYGQVRIQGPLDALETNGNLEMQNGGFTFDYLGIDMNFDFQKIELFPDRFYLTPNKLFDEDGNDGWIKGNIYHTQFDQFVFDSLEFSSGNFVLMDATAKENPDFYGFTTGKALAIIDGPLEELQVTVNASPVKSNNKPNVVYIPAYGSGNVSRHNFIRFVNRSDTGTVKQQASTSLSVVNVSTFVEVTPDVEVQILLSSEGTDVIKGAGFGNLFIDVNTLGKVEISGLLKITQGSYDFSFEGLATKNFVVKEGGTILFDQDPYQAKLDLTAVYRADKVQKLGLISDLPLSDPELQEARKTTPVDVYINIGGTLEAPEISFDIVLPDERGSGLSEFEQRLAEVKSDQNELNKQVFGLLMINKFLPKDINAGSAIGAGVNSSISDFITGQLSGYFSDWLSEIIPNAEIDIGYQRIGSGDLGLTESDQTQFEAGLTQKLFGDALTVKIGGTYNYEASSAADNANLAGDFEVEYRITPDGRIRVKAFRKSDFDAVASKNDTRTGLGLFYTKDFDSLEELFTRRKDEE